MSGFLEEVKRRNVFKVAIVYLIAGWVTMQIVDVMFPALNLPDWLTRAVAALLLVGFPFALILAWAFEMTPDGIKRERDVDRSQSITPQTGQKLNKAAFVILAIAVGFLLLDKFVWSDRVPVQADKVASAEVKPSIAVLPFVNMSGDAANEYFSDGLSEELLNLLAKIPKLHVAGRTSSFKFKDSSEDLRVIGEMLNVANVLEGSVRKSGTRLRITAQLVDTENGFHLWSETYDRELTDIFAIQDEISANVVAALKLKLLGNDIERAGRGTENTKAYDQYMQGWYFLQHVSQENLQKAILSFDNAVSLDPEFSRAHLGLVIAHQQRVSGFVGGEVDDFEKGFELVRELAQRTLDIDSVGYDALMVQLLVASVIDWDMVLASELGERAVALDPSRTIATNWLATAHAFRGNFKQAISIAKRALSIDPLNIPRIRLLGNIQLVSGEFEEALDTYQHALNLSPDSARIYGRITRTHLYQGNLEAAREVVGKEPVDWVRDMHNIMILHSDGKHEEFRTATREYENNYGVVNSAQLAEIYAYAGDLDSAFEWLRSTVAVKDPGGPWLLVSPVFEAARADPRWAEFESAFRL